MSQQSRDHKQGRYVEYDNKPGQYLYGTEECCGLIPSYGDLYGDIEIDALVQAEWYFWNSDTGGVVDEGILKGAPFVTFEDLPTEARLVIGAEGAGVYDVNFAGYTNPLEPDTMWQVALFVNGVVVPHAQVELIGIPESPTLESFAVVTRVSLADGDYLTIGVLESNGQGDQLTISRFSLTMSRLDV